MSDCFDRGCNGCDACIDSEADESLTAPKHTPGPWVASLWVNRETGDFGWSLSHDGHLVPLSTFEGDEAEAEANANLCAAAPDLLAALLEERRLRLLSQQPDVHWESLRDERRAAYAATDAAIARTAIPAPGAAPE